MVRALVGDSTMTRVDIMIFSFANNGYVIDILPALKGTGILISQGESSRSINPSPGLFTLDERFSDLPDRT